MGVHNVADKTSFQTAVVEGSKDKIVVVDYFATWCGPCKQIAPVIARWSDESPYNEKVIFQKVDVDEVPDVAQEQGIRAMPTFHIFKNGEVVEEVVGANERGLKAKIDALLKAQAEGKPYVRPPPETNWMQYLPMLIIAVLIYRYLMGM